MSRLLAILFLFALCLGPTHAGEEIEFYFFGRQHCGFSQQVVASGSLPGIVKSLRAEAELRGAEFSSSCVSLDTDIEAGKVFVGKACKGFDQGILTGDGFDNDDYRNLVHSPPAVDGNVIPEGHWPVPLAITVIHRDGEIFVNRWPSWAITRWAGQLINKKEDVRLGDDMKPIDRTPDSTPDSAEED